MSKFVLFDTSILVDHIRTSRNVDRLMQVDGPIRTSSGVPAELWRGASSPIDRKIVEELEQNHPILMPTANNWIESGQLLAKMSAEKVFEAHKLRDLHFDVLIA